MHNKYFFKTKYILLCSTTTVSVIKICAHVFRDLPWSTDYME